MVLVHGYWFSNPKTWLEMLVIIGTSPTYYTIFDEISLFFGLQTLQRHNFASLKQLQNDFFSKSIICIKKEMKFKISWTVNPLNLTGFKNQYLHKNEVQPKSQYHGWVSAFFGVRDLAKMWNIKNINGNIFCHYILKFFY